MLHEAVPSATVMGRLVNPSNSTSESDRKEAQDAADKLGIERHVASATNPQEIDAAFASLAERRVQALPIDGDSFFSSRCLQLAVLTVRHAMPSIYTQRALTDAGGLMSYGSSMADMHRQVGLRGPDPERRKAGGLAGDARNQVRACHQWGRRQSHRPRRPADAARHCGRGSAALSNAALSSAALAVGAKR
jgi:hypothetical protein